MHRLGASKITQVDFLPREVVSYCKETQTPITGTTHLSEGECIRCACVRVYVCEYFIIDITQHYRSLDCSLFTVYPLKKTMKTTLFIFFYDYIKTM